MGRRKIVLNTPETTIEQDLYTAFSLRQIAEFLDTLSDEQKADIQDAAVSFITPATVKSCRPWRGKLAFEFCGTDDFVPIHKGHKWKKEYRETGFIDITPLDSVLRYIVKDSIIKGLEKCYGPHVRYKNVRIYYIPIKPEEIKYKTCDWPSIEYHVRIYNEVANSLDPQESNDE